MKYVKTKNRLSLINILIEIWKEGPLNLYYKQQRRKEIKKSKKKTFKVFSYDFIADPGFPGYIGAPGHTGASGYKGASGADYFY